MIRKRPPHQHFSPSSEPAAATLSWWRMSNNPPLLSVNYGPRLQRPRQVCQGRQKHICHSPLHSQSMQSGPDPEQLTCFSPHRRGVSYAIRVQVSFEDLQQEEGWREGALLGKGGMEGGMARTAAGRKRGRRKTAERRG